MALKDDLKKLKMYAGAITAEEQRKFDEVLEHINTTYTSDKDKETITDFFFKEINTIKDDMEEIKQIIKLKDQLKEISEIISLSYIAKTYFKKSRNWLYQRINGNIVGGKAATFKKEEIKILENALKDISNKLNSFSLVSYQ